MDMSRYQHRFWIASIMAFGFLSCSIAEASPLSDNCTLEPRAIIEPWDIIRFDRIGQSSRSETLHILQMLARRLKAEGGYSQGTLNLGNLLHRLEPLLEGPDDEVSSAALEVIFLLGQHASQAKETLKAITISTTRDPALRLAALRCWDLVARQDEETFALLVLLLKDSDALIRGKAASSLASRGGESHIKLALPILIDLLDNPESRPGALVALSRLGPEASEALPSLESLSASLGEREGSSDEVVYLRRTILKVRGF